MVNEQLLATIRNMTAEMLAPYPEYFVVDVRIKPTNNIKLFVDGDNGVPVEKLVAFNRNLYPRLEEAGLFPDNNFSLEVSSPGLDEPLKLNRQYQKNVGRKVAVTMLDNTEKEGTLLAADEEKITIEQVIGKKKEKQTAEINLNEIKHTMVCIVF
jgi:ribosome maturation factor RimP